MEPSLQVGNQLLVKKLQYTELNRGDIVVFQRDGTLYVKRLIGLPGDIIYIDCGDVYVNGCLLEEEYVVHADNVSGQYFVPDNSYFLLGDNRANSADSRYWQYPFIEYKDVIGKVVVFIYPYITPVKEVLYEVY